MFRTGMCDLHIAFLMLTYLENSLREKHMEDLKALLSIFSVRVS